MKLCVLFVVLSWLFCALSASSSSSEGNLSVCWSTFSSLTRLSPADPIPCHSTEHVELYAAGGEQESLQIAVRTDSNITLFVTSHGAGSGGLEVRLEQVGFVWVSNATDPARTFQLCMDRATGCWIPDPLLPTLGHFRAVANVTMAMWVTITVPRGLRSSAPLKVTLSSDVGTVLGSVSIAMHIFGFDLPVTPALRNTIQLDAAHLHRSFPDFDEVQTSALVLQYAKWLLSYTRFNPGSIYDSWTRGHYKDYNSPFSFSAQEIHDLAQLGLNAITVPSSPLNQTKAFVQELRARNLSHLVTFYGFDEYNGNLSSIGKEFAPLRALFPEALTLTTAHVGMQYGGLVSEPLPFDSETMKKLSIGGIVPQTNYLPPKDNISEVQRGGGEVWTYVSVQPYKPYADLRLDNPVTDARVLFWQIRDRGFDGFLCWGFNQWGGQSGLQPIPPVEASPKAPFDDLPFLPVSAWDPATSPGSWMFGDGKVLYSGTEGPVSSIRLSNMRDGLEDYDYLSILSRNSPQQAQQLLQEVTSGDLADVLRNAKKLLSVRKAVGKAIETTIMHLHAVAYV